MADPGRELRVALPVVSLWIGIGAGFAAVRAPVWLVLLAAALAAVVWLGGSTVERWVIVGFALIGLALIGIRGWLGEPPPSAFGTHSIEFTVLEDPKSVTPNFGALNFAQEQRFLADVTLVDSGQALPVLLTVDSSHWRLSERGRCSARIDRSSGWNKFRGFARCDDAARRIQSVTRLEAIASLVRAASKQSVAGLSPKRAAGLLPGLSLGDESGLDVVSESALQSAGLGHLTAVSGANIAILLGALQLLLQRTSIGWRSRIVFQLIATAAFVVVVRPTPSVVRAAAMAMLGLWVVWQGGRRRGGRLLLTATFVLLVLDPWLAVSWGFALSVAATSGLVFLSPLFVPAEAGWLRKAGASATAAGLSTLPVLIAMGSSPTFASIPANIAAEVFVAPATISGVLAALLTALGQVGGLFAICTWLGRIAAQLGVWSAAGVLWVADRANDSLLAVPVLSWLGFAALAGAAVVWWHWRAIAATALVLTATVSLGGFALSAAAAWPPPDWQVIGCDVGQGDATLIRAGPRAAVVVDAGPEPLALLRCLRDAHIDSVPIFIPTHWHADHVGGVAALVDFAVGQVWWPCGVEPQSGRRLVERTLMESRRVAADSHPRAFGVSVLACPIGAVGADDGSSVNDSSLILTIDLPEGRVLLAADAELQGQAQLMAAFAEGAFVMLKVPHHGSAAAQTEFPRWTGATVGWVSVGIDNDYGHPDAGTLAAYRAAGVRLLTTASCGDVALTARGLVSARECEHP